jgi:hypothetical protein
MSGNRPQEKHVTNLQLLLTIGIPTFAVLFSFLYTNARISSLEQRLIVMEADMRQFYHLTGKLEGRIDALEGRKQ